MDKAEKTESSANPTKDKSSAKKPSKKGTAPTTPNPQVKRGSGRDSIREQVMQLSVENAAMQRVGSGNPNNSFHSSNAKPPVSKRGEQSAKKQTETASTKGSVRRGSKNASNIKNEALASSASKKLSSNENFELQTESNHQESTSIVSELKKNPGIAASGQKQSSSYNNLNSKTIGGEISSTQEVIDLTKNKSPSKKAKHSQQRLKENQSKLSEKKIVKQAQSIKKIGSKEKRNSGNDLKSLELKPAQRSNSHNNGQSLVSPQGSQKIGSRKESNNSKQLSSKQILNQMEEEESKINPPLLSEDDNNSFQDTDISKIRPPDEIMATPIKNMTVTDTAPMILKVPADGAQLTSKKNSNITSEANESSKSNQPKQDEQVIDDNSLDDGEQNEADVEEEQDSPSPLNGYRDSKTNIAEQFRLAMQQQNIHHSFGDSLIPPPEDLIKKSVFEEEPVKTGAAISFIKFNRLYGREKQEKLNPDNKNKTAEGNTGTTGGSAAPGFMEITPAYTISDYTINASEAKRIVYCRFGEKYISDLEKRKNSNITSLAAPNLSSASYLINIKKLVEENNIEGEKRDFKSMRSGQMKVQMPPQQFYKLTGPEDKTLIFESRFESGNLLSSIKVSEEEYDLVLQNDINTNGNTQWYFFRVSNTHAGQKVRFNFLNLAKTDSLYNYGMKILCFSNSTKEKDGVGWHRIGESINYYQNQYKRDQCRFSRTYYTFTFTHTFKHSDDQVFFAHCFPYTYSDLQEDLNTIEKQPDANNFYHKGILTRTLAGNRCDYLTITSKDKDPKSAKALAKKGVFISSRVHPGESNASWMMKGVIEFLVSNTPEAKALRDRFVFKIVPILNPDGVINGNYRCSLAGQDLNRRWKAPSKILHPVCSAVKKLVRSFAKEREVILFCDLHGHSRRKNIFMYGNVIKEEPHATRVFPYIMSKLCDFFSFEQSRFSVSRTKEGTARVAMFKELNIANVFTMEASFCGADRGKNKDMHFTTDHLMMAGQRLLESLIVYCKIEIKQNINQVKKKKEDDEEPEYQDLNALDLEKELTQNTKLIKMTTGDEMNSSASDSEPSADNLEEDELAKIVPIKKQKTIPPVKPKPAPPVKKPLAVIKKPVSPQEKKRPPIKEFSKSPTKRPFGYKNALDMRRRKPEMKDAWTQTTPKSKEQLEKEKREHKQRKNAHYLLLQQQQQQMMMQKQQQFINQQNRAQYPNNSAQHQMEPHHQIAGTLGEFAAKNQQKQAELRNQGRHINPGQHMSSITTNYNHNKPQANSSNSFNLNPMLLSQTQVPMNQSQRPQMQSQNEAGQSPQPQIRIRTDTFKSKPSNDLAQYEQRLVNKHQDPVQILMGPQHGSVTQNRNHRGSNKRLPQIQSSNSQRKNIGEMESEYHHIQRVKTLNQQQFNSFGNYNNEGMQKMSIQQQSNQINKNMSQTVHQQHQRQISGQSPSTQQRHQNLIQTQYGGQIMTSPNMPMNQSMNNGRRLIHAPGQQQIPNQPNMQAYSDKKPIQSQQNQRQHYQLSVSPNKLNRIKTNILAGSMALSGAQTNMQGGVEQQIQFQSALSNLNQGQAQKPMIQSQNQNLRDGAQTHGHNSIATFQTQQKKNYQ